MRLCVITHTFPPSTHANAKRPHYLVRGFLEAGWKVDVFTHPLGQPPGTVETVTHPALRIFRLSDPVERLQGWCRTFPLLYRMVVLGVAGVMWPDSYACWARRVFRVVRAQSRYDRTLAFVLPASVLLSGRVAGWVNDTWTFDYQESVTPQQRHMTRRSPLQRWLQPRLAALERNTLRQAGRVVFTTNANRQAYVGAGLAEARVTAHLPYFYDASAFAGASEAVAPGFELVYFGTFDWRGARSPETFLRALAKFLEQSPKARPSTRFSFYGTWLSEHNRFVEELDLRDVVSIHPPIGYDQYLQKLRRSPVLLLVVAPAHSLFMPSKIVDYFGARRPIMAFVPHDSEMREVLDQAGMSEYVAEESNVEGGVGALAKLWERHQAGNLSCDSEQTRYWSSETQIPRYVELVEHR